MTPLKVLHIFDHSVPLHSGYSFRSLAILREQHKLGIETVQLTSTKHYAQAPADEMVDGLKFYRTAPGVLAKVPVLNQWDVISTLKQRLAELITQEKPDILHAHSPSLNAIAAASVARRFGIPLVYEMRASWEDAAVSHGTCKEGDLRYRLGQWLEKKALHSADHVVTICQGLATQVQQWGIQANNISIVPNGVDIDAFPPLTERNSDLASKHQLEGKTVLGFLGSFYRYEGLHILLDALAKLKDSQPNLVLLLVGGGLQEQALKAQAEQLGISDRVIFTGRVPHQQVAQYYSLVDIFVYPRESIRLTELVTPLKPLEAMAQLGLVLASDIGGHRELIQHGETGVLFKADDAAALALSISELLANQHDWDRLKQNGRRFVEQVRNWKNSTAPYPDIYRALLQKQNDNKKNVR